MGADEAGTLRRFTELREQVLEPLIAGHHGRVVKLIGDGLLVEFASVVDALACGVAWQTSMVEQEAAAADDRRFRFRIGINLGDIIVEGGDIHGDGVNIAARLEGLAEPGGIYLSDDAYRQVRGKVEVEFEDLGDRELKNVAEPVRVYRVAIQGSGAVSPKPIGKTLLTPDKPSVAVLPFTNMSGDPEQEYFSDGLTEDIITGLSRFHSLFVIARNSAFTFKGQAVNVQEVGKKLGAHYVIEGSVRKAGNRVRVTAQLIDAQTGNHLWAQNFDRDLDDIFAVQDEVTRSIVSSLPERVGAADLERVKRKRTDRMVAYDYFLHGRELHHRFSKEDCIEGIQLLEKAVELDPSFAQAWAWLSCIVGQAWVRGYLPNKNDLWKRCVAAARKALELDEGDSECHRILSEIYLIQRKYDQAEYHNERGLSLNPNDPRLVVQRGYLLAYVGQPDKGVEWVKKVLTLDPFHPENYYANLGIVLHAAHRYEDAVEVFKRVPILQAAHYAYLASCHAHLGQSNLAEEHANKVLELEPDFTIAKYSATLRYKQPADLDHYINGLRKAGLPE
jgi:adenylate cyclase